MKLTRLILILIGLTAAAPLGAGVLLTMVDQRADRPDDQSLNKMYLDKDRVRMEIASKDETQTVIYRLDKNLFWIINTKDQTYTEFSKADVDKLQQQMEGASAEMEEALKQMPPEQRKMMEEHMKGMLSQSTPQVTYQKVASGQKVNQWSCTQYEGTLNDKKESEVWTTDRKSLGLSREDFDVLKEMSKFWEGVARSGSRFFKLDEADQESEGHFSGIPVKTIHYARGKATGSTELQSAVRQDFDPAMFDLPSGLKKQELPQGKMEE